MKPFLRHQAVETDLARYGRHIAADNPQAAANFVTAAENAVRLIAMNPGLGRLRRWRLARLARVRTRPLERPYSAWLVIYRETTEAVEIIRVIHGSQDLRARLQEPPEA